MDEKELRKLRRQDLLQLLLLQSREAAKLRETLETLGEEHAEATGSRAKLIEKLNDKDAQLERLTEKLNDKDAQIARLTARLNDKDAQLEKLKGRLDEKDAKIKRLADRLEMKDAEIELLRAAPVRLRSEDGSYGEINLDSLLSAVKDSLSEQIKSGD